MKTSSSFAVVPAEEVTTDSSGGPTPPMRSTWLPRTALSSTALISYLQSSFLVGRRSSFACRRRRTISARAL